MDRHSGSEADFARIHRRHLTEHGKIVRLIAGTVAAVTVIALFAQQTDGDNIVLYSAVILRLTLSFYRADTNN